MLVAGLKQSKKTVEANEAKLAYVANDADENIVKSFLQICKKTNVEVNRDLDMKELAKLCKIEVPTAVVVVTI